MNRVSLKKPAAVLMAACSIAWPTAARADHNPPCKHTATCDQTSVDGRVLAWEANVNWDLEVAAATSAWQNVDSHWEINSIDVKADTSTTVEDVEIDDKESCDTGYWAIWKKNTASDNIDIYYNCYFERYPVWGKDGDISEANLALRRKALEEVIGHELGHALGLPDLAGETNPPGTPTLMVDGLDDGPDGLCDCVGPQIHDKSDYERRWGPPVRPPSVGGECVSTAVGDGVQIPC